MLLVGINSDDSLRRPKGAGRPLMTAAARAGARAGLAWLPSGARCDGRHAVLGHATGAPLRDAAVLAVWAVAAIALAARTFRWE